MSDFPASFLANMRAMLGDEYDAFFEAISGEAYRALRLNPKRGFSMDGDNVPWEVNGRYVASDYRPGRDLRHLAGAYYMQDPSAMAPARALNLKPGECALDLCAAPGGKSGQLLSMLDGEGLLVSNEPDGQRARALSSNLERLGADNAVVVSAYPDALAAKWPGYFDAIMVDAPCSGEGMFRKDVQARSQWTEKSPEGCAQRQAQILDAAAMMLRPGGRLCYSTCTFNEIENERTIAGFLGRHDDFAPVDFALCGVGASTDGMMRLWPHKLRGEGHFVALLRRDGEAVPRDMEIKRHSREAMAVFDDLKKIVPGSWADRYEGWTLVMNKDQLCALPVGTPDLAGIKALRFGLELAARGKGYVKPEHALAMAVEPSCVARTFEPDDKRARLFAKGEAIDGGQIEDGWTLITHENMAIGWGKVVNGVIKNHIPKGLRLN